MDGAPLRERLEIRLGALKGALAERCAREGVSAAAFVRDAIASALGSEGHLGSARSALLARLAGERSRVRLPSFESARLHELAIRAGLSPSAYVSKLVRDAVNARSAQVGVSGAQTLGFLEALIASNSRLAPIGVNLNQVARSLNGAPGQITLEERETLHRVTIAVQEHLQEAAAVLALLRPGRPTMRDQLAAVARTLTEIGRTAKSSPAVGGDEQKSVVQAIAGALAHVKDAVGLLPPGRSDRGTRGWRKQRGDGGDDDEQAH